MHATCILSTKQTFSDWIYRWQPDKKGHLYQFLFSVCHLELASKSLYYILFRLLYVIWHTLCDFGVCCTVAKQLKMVCCLVQYSDTAIRWLFSSSASSNPKVKLPCASNKRVSILPPYHHHHRLATLAIFVP